MDLTLQPDANASRRSAAIARASETLPGPSARLHWIDWLRVAAIAVKWLAVFAILLPVTLVLVELALRTPVLRVLPGTRVRRPTLAGPAPVAAAVERDIRSKVTGHGRAG